MCYNGGYYDFRSVLLRLFEFCTVVLRLFVLFSVCDCLWFFVLDFVAFKSEMWLTFALVN